MIPPFWDMTLLQCMVVLRHSPRVEPQSGRFGEEKNRLLKLFFLPEGVNSLYLPDRDCNMCIKIVN
jgi:hypothetical protein